MNCLLVMNENDENTKSFSLLSWWKSFSSDLVLEDHE